MESGRANHFINLHEKGYRLADRQQDLIPFQRMVLQEGMKRKQERIEEKQQQAQSGAGGRGGRQTNPLAEPGGGKMQGETVEYVNTHGGEKDVDI